LPLPFSLFFFSFFGSSLDRLTNRTTCTLWPPLLQKFVALQTNQDFLPCEKKERKEEKGEEEKGDWFPEAEEEAEEAEAEAEAEAEESI
jgi:hypothetical protein